MPKFPVKAEKKSVEAQWVSVKVVKKTQTDDKVQRSLHYSNMEGAFANAAGNITGSYTTPYALALKATNAEIGFLNALQNLAATFAQIPGARLSAWLGSRKSAWFLSHIFQRIFWIPIILLPFIGASNPVLFLIIMLTVVSFFANMRGPAWSSLMGDLVPKHKWGKYFGWRNTILGIAGLIAILAAGQILIWFGFSILFTVALVLGFLSIYFFMKMYEPGFRREYHYTHTIRLSPREWVKSLNLHKNFAYFTLYMTAVRFAENIASPFFAVYQLRYLNVGYGWYAALIVVEALVMIFSQPYWGRLCDKVGDRKIMVVTGILICFVPFFYLFVTNPYEIVFVGMFSGFAWAGFGITTFNFMLAASPAEKRAEYTANFSFFTGLGVVFGSLAGGVLAVLAQGNVLLWMQGLQIVFLISFLARIGCLAILPKLKETRIEERGPPVAEIFWRTVAVRPVRGVVHAIIHPNYTEWDREFRGFLRNGWNTLKYKIKMRRNR